MNGGDFLDRLAKKEKPELKIKKGFQIGVIIVIPPFPYEDKREAAIYQDLSILFRKQNLDGVHLGDVKIVNDTWAVAGDSGFILIGATSYILGYGDPVLSDEELSRLNMPGREIWGLKKQAPSGRQGVQTPGLFLRWMTWRYVDGVKPAACLKARLNTPKSSNPTSSAIDDILNDKCCSK